MKRLCCCLILLLCLGGCAMPAPAQPTAAQPSPQPLAGYTVALDPGHGGHDQGAVGALGIPEAALNLDVALHLQQLLLQAGANVVMTRSDAQVVYAARGDTLKMRDMAARVAHINARQPHVTVSIHMNTFTDARYSGFQAFYYPGSSGGAALAQALQQSVCDALQPDNHRRTQSNADLYILRETTGVCVLAECGFLSNPDEEALLCSEDYRRKLAQALYAGIAQYLLQG